jgi:hypothetical protein
MTVFYQFFGRLDPASQEMIAIYGEHPQTEVHKHLSEVILELSGEGARNLWPVVSRHRV